MNFVSKSTWRQDKSLSKKKQILYELTFVTLNNKSYIIIGQNTIIYTKLHYGFYRKEEYINFYRKYVCELIKTEIAFLKRT